MSSYRQNPPTAEDIYTHLLFIVQTHFPITSQDVPWPLWDRCVIRIH